MTEQEIRNKIQDAGLRVTGARFWFLQDIIIDRQTNITYRYCSSDPRKFSNRTVNPLLYIEPCRLFTEKGLIQIGSNAGGIARYEVKTTKVRKHNPRCPSSLLFARIAEFVSCLH